MTASSNSVTTDSLKRRSDDIGWEYAVLTNPSNLDRVKCILCEKTVSGGIYRLKQHIAGVRGNVVACTKSGKDDQLKCIKALDVSRKKRGKKEREKDMISQVNINDDIIEAICKETLDKVKEYVCKWAYEASIPFNAFELDSCKMMFEAIGRYGVGCRPPTRYEMSEPFLKKEVERTKSALQPQEVEWKLNGCSIIIDAWSDRNRRSIMNLCVNSRLGTVFISSKDFSDTPHTGQVIHNYVDQCIQEVGPENVVQVVTNNASNNMAAAKLLKESRPQIFWSSCAAHSINLMLEAIANLPKFKKTIDLAKALTIFIYAHHKTLAMMRTYTKKRDIVRPGVTRFASSFLSLQRISEKREQLRAMFTSNEWEQYKFSKTVKGKAAYNTVLSLGFWTGISSCLQTFGPLVKVLRLVDGDKKPSMGFVYGEIKKAKEEIKASLNNIAKNYQPIIDIIDAKMKDRLDSPLHLTAYMLNPFYHYRDPLLHLDEDVSIGFIDCLDVVFPGNFEMQGKLMDVELTKYKNRNSLFGRELAIAACMRENNIEKFDPVGWWSNYSAITPNLQRFAMRILSLTTSSSGCERNWSAFEGIHTKKRNKLLVERLNNLVYVNFNAKLMNKHKKLQEKEMEVLLAKDDAICAQDWIVERLDLNDDVVGEGNLGSSSSMDEDGPRRSVRLRELDEDDFSSDDGEELVDVNVEFESDDEDRVYGDEPPSSFQSPQS